MPLRTNFRPLGSIQESKKKKLNDLLLGGNAVAIKLAVAGSKIGLIVSPLNLTAINFHLSLVWQIDFLDNKCRSISGRLIFLVIETGIS